MEYIIGFIVLIVIMICLGVSRNIIIGVVLGALGLAALLIYIFFIYAMTLLLRSVGKRGEFVRTYKGDKQSFDRAYYMIEGQEYPCALPAEFVMRDIIYKKGKEVGVRLVKKKGLVLDKNAVSCIVLGFVVFTLIAAAAVSAVLQIL